MRRLAVAACVIALAPLPGRAHTHLSPGDCAWLVKTDADTANIAFPDEFAQYYSGNYTTVPGVELTIRGTFPRARYISFHLYEGSMPAQAITDYEIVAEGGINPFVAGADRTRTGEYAIRIIQGSKPANPEPNTLYAQGLNGEPLLAGTIIYRIYLAEGDDLGGVPLPQMWFSAEGPDEEESVPVSCGPLRQLPQQTDVLHNASNPFTSSAPPTNGTWAISRSRPQPTNVGGSDVYTGNAFFANFDNEYLRLISTRYAGDVVAIRFKPPTFAQTRGTATMPADAQLRYWSVCTNDLGTTRYVGCVADEGAKVAADGFSTIVISDVDHKPRTLAATDNWIPNGPYADYFILYRHMLPHDFPEAIQNVKGSSPSDGDIRTAMGDYYPVTKICPTARFEIDYCGLPA